MDPRAVPTIDKGNNTSVESETVLLTSDLNDQYLKYINGLEPVSYDVCLHHLILERCLERPDSTAVCAWDGEFTYGELDKLSSQLASRLGSLGVKPEKFVPICFEKSQWTSVAMLGVLKAGGAFTLLDPTHPLERLREICRIIEADVIVCSSQKATLAVQLVKNTVILDGGKGEPICGTVSHLTHQQEATPYNAAYVVFTSGSTGKPKGVVIEHRNYCSALVTQKEAFGLDEQTRYFQFSSYAFDTSISDHFMTWYVGGCVCIPSEEERRDKLSESVERLRANTLDFTPSLARLVQPMDVPNVKALVLGGELMKPYDVALWADKVRLINGYGPSECSVTATIVHSVKSNADPANIGYPTGCVGWIVDPDDHDKLLDPSAIGELVLEGAIVGRGYLHEPEKTGASFISNPRWITNYRTSSYQGRFYKTGDLARYAPERDGTITFCGRKDSQIKIRGQRLEAGEVETALSQFLPVGSQVLVTTTASHTGSLNRVLTAFIALDGQIFQKQQEWDGPNSSRGAFFVVPDQDMRKKFLKIDEAISKKLPIYMKPDKYLLVRGFPVTTTGKADVKLLQNQAESLSWEDLDMYTAIQETKRAPQNRTEEIIQKACADTCSRELESVGLDDSFYNLGGDSLLAISLVNRLRKHGIRLAVSDVLRHPKLSDLSNLSRAKHDASPMKAETRIISYSSYLGFASFEDLVAASSTPSLPSDIIEKVLPITAGQEVRLHGPIQHMILNFDDAIDLDKLSSACRSLVERHEILRVIFQQVQNTPCQIILSQVHTKIHLLEVQADLQHHVTQVCLKDELPIPPFETIITKFTLVRTPSGTGALIVRLSHAQYDGFSLETILEDLKRFYENEQLVPATQFSEHINEWLRQKTSPQALELWRSKLRGHRMTLFPKDTQRALEPHWSLKMFETGEIQPVEGITPATLVNAAWSLLLKRLSGRTEVMFGIITNGRNGHVQDAETCVGLCHNQIPLVIMIDPEMTVRTFLNSIQNQYIDSMDSELVELKDITEAEEFEDFGSVVNFRNAEVESEAPVTFGGIKGRKAYHGALPQRHHVIVIAVPKSSAMLLKITAPNFLLDEQRHEEMLEQLARTISLLASSVGKVIGELEI